MKASLVIAALAMAVGAPAAPQVPLRLEPYIGGFRYSDGAWSEVWNETIPPALLLGARLSVPITGGLRAELNYGFAALTGRRPEVAYRCLVGPCNAPIMEIRDSRAAHVYYATGTYALPVRAPLAPLVSIGAGRIAMKGRNGNWITDWLASFGVGSIARLSGSLTLRWDLKDQVQFCETAPYPKGLTKYTSACPYETTRLHHLELSLGTVLNLPSPRLPR